MDKKKIANNILEFLIDPTRIPVRERLYFRPEENLKNESFEGAKQDACIAYGSEKLNSDMYPARNRSLKTQREAAVMDKKSIIASLDILSKNFKDENDPIAKDLRTMAFAMSKMAEEEVQSRLATEAPDFDGMTVEASRASGKKSCPDCGQTLYCMSCAKGKKKDKKASEEALDIDDCWTKEASDAVAQAIIADVLGATEEVTEDVKSDAEACDKEAKKKDAPAADGTPAHEQTETPAQETAEHAVTDTADVAEKAEEKAEKAAPMAEKAAEEKIVKTDMLQTASVYDVELVEATVDQAELTDDEKSRLSQLFIK